MNSIAKKKFELVIVIVNYKTPEMVLDVLESIQSELVTGQMKVIIVDNHSQDLSVKTITLWINDNDPSGNNFQLVESSQNGGFSSGNNIGIHAASANFYLLLNSDTIVRPGFLSVMLDSIKSDDEIGMVGPRLEWPDKTPQESGFYFHTPISEFLRAANTGIISSLLNRYVVARSVVNTPCTYDWVSFACVLIRAEVIRDVGLLDDKFFMYFEDVEFSYRAKKSGWKTLYQPKAEVVHLRGGTSPLKSHVKLRKRLPRYFYESRSRYFYLLYGRLGLLLANILWSFGACISEARTTLSSTYQGNIAEKQWRDIWINFFKPSRQYTHPNDYDKT